MILVIDIGTTSVRAAAMDAEGTVTCIRSRPQPPVTPVAGLVEFDAVAMAAAMTELANEVIVEVGHVDAVGITAQRASTIVWDRSTGIPVGPGLGWQDLRTVGECMSMASQHHVAVAPNQTATKAAWLLDHYDPDRSRDLCVGTVDAWAVWTLSAGRIHATDHSNAAVTGLYSYAKGTWDERLCELFRVPVSTLPAVVDSIGAFGEASALPGAPIITAVLGDQQASLAGQSCVRSGDAKITFGTGGMLDVFSGDDDRLVASGRRSGHGCFGIVAWSEAGRLSLGAEAIMLSAGSNVEWLCNDLGLIRDVTQSHDLASTCPDSDGVVYVPAPLGLGTPHWDYGARGTLLGLTRGTTAAHVARAVLEGVAQRGADLVEAAEADLGIRLERVRIDGGMSRNPTFVQALADSTGRPVEVAPHTECTTIGAGLLAAVGSGELDSVTSLSDLWRPAAIVEPTGPAHRDRWAEAVRRSAGWIPELSVLDF
ncbi:MAG: FGGY-family carbohydrate kinase [Actinomycetota bacterium]|nr:FGGY-family carbohydrate kinase [Actinomycetota bacterium]MDA3028615.1 FGGY-family carbohydrate kinase [Actinomycetota bacterium]